MRNVYQEIGHRIQKIRENENLSQEEFGRLIGGYSPTAISLFESGARKIKLEELMKIAEIFDKQIQDLLPGTDLLNLNDEAVKFRAKITERKSFDQDKFKQDLNQKTGFKKLNEDL